MPEAATLSSSEAVRDREPVEASEREPAREPEPKPEAPRSAFGDVAERVRSTMDEYRAARERISAGQRDYATELAPAIQAALSTVVLGWSWVLTHQELWGNYSVVRSW